MIKLENIWEIIVQNKKYNSSSINVNLTSCTSASLFPNQNKKGLKTLGLGVSHWITDSLSPKVQKIHNCVHPVRTESPRRCDRVPLKLHNMNYKGGPFLRIPETFSSLSHNIPNA